MSDRSSRSSKQIRDFSSAISANASGAGRSLVCRALRFGGVYVPGDFPAPVRPGALAHDPSGGNVPMSSDGWSRCRRRKRIRVYQLHRHPAIPFATHWWLPLSLIRFALAS